MRCDVFFFKQKTAYEMRISDGSSDACSSDLLTGGLAAITALASHPSAPGLVAVGHTSFTRPDTITAWRPDGSSTPLTALPGPAIEPTAVSQVRYPSTAGTEVPMLLVHGEATAIDDRTPTPLTG